MVEANKGKRDVEREIKFERVKVEERKENKLAYGRDLIRKIWASIVIVRKVVIDLEKLERERERERETWHILKEVFTQFSNFLKIGNCF